MSWYLSVILKCSMLFRRVSCVLRWKIEEIETVCIHDTKICVCSRKEVYISGVKVFSLITSFFIFQNINEIFKV